MSVINSDPYGAEAEIYRMIGLINYVVSARSFRLKKSLFELRKPKYYKFVINLTLQDHS